MIIKNIAVFTSFSIALCICFQLVSCGKHSTDNTPITPVVPPVIPPASNSSPTVYTAGTLGSGNNTTAVYWRNDTMITLPGVGASVQAITVSGNDVYTAGNVEDTIGYWKNLIFVPLFKVTAGYATSIAVSGSDVYVSGNTISNGHSVAEYWKNSTEIKLTSDTIISRSSAIAISGSDVYVAGTAGGLPVYWKNGVKVNVTDSARGGYANAIALSGSDVYLAGGEVDSSEHFIAKYWKNGAPSIVSDTIHSTVLFAIGVSGDNVCVGGYQKIGSLMSTDNFVAWYWNNSTATVLTNSFGLVSSIAIDGSDVYVAYSGDVSSSHSVATYAKNGVKKILTDGTTDATAYTIFVKK